MFRQLSPLACGLFCNYKCAKATIRVQLRFESLKYTDCCLVVDKTVFLLVICSFEADLRNVLLVDGCKYFGSSSFLYFLQYITSVLSRVVHYRDHGRQIEYIRSNLLNPRPTPTNKASKCILQATF